MQAILVEGGTELEEGWCDLGSLLTSCHLDMLGWIRILSVQESDL